MSVVSTVCAWMIIPRTNWESVYIRKLTYYVHVQHISITLKDVAVCQLVSHSRSSDRVKEVSPVELPSTLWKWRMIAIYKGCFLAATN